MKGIILQITTMAIGIFLILGSGGGGGDTSTPATETPTDNYSPNTPSGVTAFSTQTSIFVDWNLDSISDARSDRYQVCYATESITDFDSCSTYANGNLETVTFNSVVIASIIEGKSYFIRVRALAGSGNVSAPSLNVSATPNLGLGLNDTGIMACVNDTLNAMPSCPVQGYPNQDAEKGRDVAFALSNEDGDAGFSFTKLDDAGLTLDDSANEWACVKDNVTGLIWEVKTLNNKDDTFSWYSTDNTNNAGSSGSDASGESLCVGFDGSDPTSYCNTQAYAERVNAGSHCGLTNWLMPTRQELISIVHYGQVEPAIEQLFFKNISTELYWSGTPTFSSSTASDFAWATNFGYGGSAKQSKLNKLRVRLVSHGQ